MPCARGCCPTFADHVRSIRFGSRAGDVVRANQRDAAFAKDREAYRRLRRDGLQPPRIDGCAALEARADHVTQVTMGDPAHGAQHAQAARILADT